MSVATIRWELFGTSVGLKALMAVSGIVLTAWVSLHMLGNLLVFGGPELINGYGGALQGSPILVVIRAGLAAAAIVHVIGAVILTRRSRGARSARYRRALKAQDSTVSGRSMRWGGLAVLLFVGYHVAHIYGGAHPSYVPGDVYHNVVAGLADPIAASLYIGAALVFGLHLHHGTWSLFRSLGHARLLERALRRGTAVFSALVTAGFIAPCVAALAGWL